MFNWFFQHTRRPEGFWGRVMLKGMNKGHASISNWGMSYWDLKKDYVVLDVGCGGGANIKEFLKKCSEGFVYGIDYSKDSVEISKRLNKESLNKNCEIKEGNVMDLPYEDNCMDIVSAFETVYFWPDLNKGFKEVYRVLKQGGKFLIVCEGSDPSNTKWTSIIEGMTLRSGEQLKQELINEGFKNIKLFKKEKEWITLISEK